MNAIPIRVSHNFAIAKTLAIMFVATGHFFGGILWIPVTMGLFMFAWSSAFFTTIKHGDRIVIGTFWRGKLRNIGLHFLLIQAFLLILAACRGRDGIITWQTLVHLCGQSGWLNWFGIRNSSPLGNGLWFFTLLLIFYLVFPLLSRWQRKVRASTVISVTTLLIALWLSATIDVGHALWLTAAAFIIGIHCARHTLPGDATVWFALAVAGTLAMGLINAGFGVQSANNALIELGVPPALPERQ